MAVPPNRTWTSTINNALDSAVDGVDQWQQLCYEMVANFLAAGWTAQQSSDGTTAGAGNNLASKASMKLDTQGNGWWIVLQSPAGFVQSGESVYLLMYANTGSGDTTPQPFSFRFSKFAYNLDGTTTTLPTAGGAEGSTSSTNIVGWNNPDPGNFLVGYSSRGDVWFMAKRTASPEINFCFAVVSNEDADGGGQGDLRFWVYYASSNANIFGTSTSIHTTYRAMRRDGLLAINPAATTLTGTILGGATNGLDDFGQAKASPVWIGSATGSDGRYWGQWVDVYGCDSNTTFEEVDDTEDLQDFRRVCLGGVWWYLPTAQLPLD